MVRNDDVVSARAGAERVVVLLPALLRVLLCRLEQMLRGSALAAVAGWVVKGVRLVETW